MYRVAKLWIKIKSNWKMFGIERKTIKNKYKNKEKFNGKIEGSNRERILFLVWRKVF